MYSFFFLIQGGRYLAADPTFWPPAQCYGRSGSRLEPHVFSGTGSLAQVTPRSFAVLIKFLRAFVACDLDTDMQRLALLRQTETHLEKKRLSVRYRVTRGSEWSKPSSVKHPPPTPVITVALVRADL